MPKYVIERDLPGAGELTADQLHAISQKSCGAKHPWRCKRAAASLKFGTTRYKSGLRKSGFPAPMRRRMKHEVDSFLIRDQRSEVQILSPGPSFSHFLQELAGKPLPHY